MIADDGERGRIGFSQLEGGASIKIRVREVGAAVEQGLKGKHVVANDSLMQRNVAESIGKVDIPLCRHKDLEDI